jgi:hypothetical protein
VRQNIVSGHDQAKHANGGAPQPSGRSKSQ